MGSFNSNFNLLRWNIIAVCILYNTFFWSSVENASCLQFNLLAHFIQWRQHFAATIRAFLQMHLHRKQKYTGAVQKKGLFHRTEATCHRGFFFPHRGVRGGLWSPRIVHQRCVSVRGRLDRTRMWAEGLSPTLHRPRSLPRGQVWLPPGLDGWTLHYRWASVTHTFLHTWQKGPNYTGNLFMGRLKRATLECECQYFKSKRIATHFCRCLPPSNKYFCMTHKYLVIFSVFRSEPEIVESCR